MSTGAAKAPDRLTSFEQLRLGRHVLDHEAAALGRLACRLDASFCRAVERIHGCRGSVIVAGMGKAGLVGQKIMATLASTGTRAHWLHPAEAVHGDLGRLHRDDLVLLLSHSGETEEIVRLLPVLADMAVPIVALTASAGSTLGRAAAVTVALGPLEEADPMRLAPSTSTTAMLAVGDALALVVSRMRGFGPHDFARFHPAGSLGRRLLRVEHLMRGLAQCRVADRSCTVREVFAGVSRPGRRTGAIMLVDTEGALCGIFTDSDLARLFERRCDAALDRPIGEVMTPAPLAVPLGTMAADAVTLMAARKISELPVVDPARRPAGLIDVTDVVAVFPDEAPAEPSLPEESNSAAAADAGYCRLFAEPPPRETA